MTRRENVTFQENSVTSERDTLARARPYGDVTDVTRDKRQRDVTHRERDSDTRRWRAGVTITVKAEDLPKTSGCLDDGALDAARAVVWNAIGLLVGMLALALLFGGAK